MRMLVDNGAFVLPSTEMFSNASYLASEEGNFGLTTAENTLCTRVVNSYAKQEFLPRPVVCEFVSLCEKEGLELVVKI